LRWASNPDRLIALGWDGYIFIVATLKLVDGSKGAPGKNDPAAPGKNDPAAPGAGKK